MGLAVAEDMMARQKRSTGGKVTIRSVAERAGVSAMTVSNVVNGKGRVGQETADTVRRAIDELGYTPNVEARRLASSTPTTIGMIYGNQQSPFLDAILVGALRATTARGLHLIIRESATFELADTEEALRALVFSGAEALLLIPPFAEIMSGTPRLVSSGLPAAAIATGRAMEGVFTVRIDNRKSIRDMVELLIAKGHRRIGFVSGPMAHSDAQERRRGYEEAMADAGLPAPPELMFQGDFHLTSGEEAARVMLNLPEPPTAIVASNDEMAAGVIAEAHRRRLKLPEELAVTGFDDTALAERLWPPLTTVLQPLGAMAYQATELLIEALQAGREELVYGDVVIPHRIVERLSTAGVP